MSEENVTQAEHAAADFKSMTVDGTTTIVNHGLKEIRDDEEARKRQEGFDNGTLKRFRMCDFSGGVH